MEHLEGLDKVFHRVERKAPAAARKGLRPVRSRHSRAGLRYGVLSGLLRAAVKEVTSADVSWHGWKPMPFVR
jgi:hypothetical protein